MSRASRREARAVRAAAQHDANIRDDQAAAVVAALPEPVGDDRWDAAMPPRNAIERGQLERLWADLFAVPREKRRRLRGVLDHLWESRLNPAGALYAAAFHAEDPGDAPWGSPLRMPTSDALAQRFVCTHRRVELSTVDLMAWRLAYWVDDDGKPLPPPGT
jgi:hypothetical protein